MTKQHRIAPLPEPAREQPCFYDDCAGAAYRTGVPVREYNGVQTASYRCSNAYNAPHVFPHGDACFEVEVYWDCGRCGALRADHLVFHSAEHGEVALCPTRIEDASFAVGAHASYL